MSMPKRLSITEFLSEVPPEYSNFVSQTHGLLTENGYKSKFEIRKKHGFTARYNTPKTKGLALQFFIRDNMLHMYLYNIFLYEHDGFLENLPSVIINEFAGYRDCTDTCNPVCTEETLRLKFTINGTQYRKCPSGQKLFAVDEEVTGLLSVLQKWANRA